MRPPGPTLSPIICPSCLGDGHFEAEGGGRFDERDEVFVPAGAVELCATCGGCGELLVCRACGDPLRLGHGGELCGCSVTVEKAA